MRAFNNLPARFEDGRHIAMEDGLRSIGYDVVRGTPEPDIGPDDVCISWNLYGPTAERAKKCQEAQARWIVAEEAYIRAIRGQKYFALALDGHNGYGRWNIEPGSRWEMWGLSLRPWRQDGEHILVCGQRGFGYNAMAMPDQWPDQILDQLRHRTSRPIWFRAHPRRRRPDIEVDREGEEGPSGEAGALRQEGQRHRRPSRQWRRRRQVGWSPEWQAREDPRNAARLVAAIERSIENTTWDDELDLLQWHP